MKGFVSDMVLLLEKYSLYEYLESLIDTGAFPKKQHWKFLVYTSVYRHEEISLRNRMSSNEEFSRFIQIHNSITPHYLWKLAAKYPNHLEAIHYILKLCVTLRYVDSENLCHICGKFYRDIITHVVLSCTCTESFRDDLWCSIINVSDMLFSVH